MAPWAAGTEIAQNTQKPNYVFRVSANDDYADKFLVRYATEVLKKAKPGLLLENTAWGQSNEVGLNKWLGQKGIKPVGIEKFKWGDPDMSPQLLRLKNAGADHIIMVANAPEGAQVVKSRAKIGWEIPMVAHWGISGGIVSGMFGTVGEDYSTLATIRRTGGVVPDATWDTNWAAIRKLVPVATALGVRLVSFHAGFLPEDAADPAYDKLVTRLSRIADLFGEAVIDLAFETGQEDCRTLRGFLDRLNKSNVGANFDPANMILYGKGDPVESVKALAGYVKSVHVKDALPAAKPGQWGKEVAVGTGAVDWPNFFAALNAGKFTGYLCIEREAGEQRIADITTAKNFLLNTMAKVK